MDKDGRTVHEQMVSECLFPDADNPPEWPPTTKMEIPEKWTALSDDGNPLTITHDFLVTQFGQALWRRYNMVHFKKGSAMSQLATTGP